MRPALNLAAGGYVVLFGFQQGPQALAFHTGSRPGFCELAVGLPRQQLYPMRSLKSTRNFFSAYSQFARKARMIMTYGSFSLCQ